MIKKVNRASIGLILLMFFATGCISPETREKMRFSNPFQPNVWTVAVVPFKNDSGSEHFSTITMTDEFYTELASVQDNIQVLSVNHVLAAQHKLGISKIKDTDDLAAIAEELGADALFVGSVTRYQPYPPPLIGIVVQIYEQRRPGETVKPDSGEFDPGELTRRPQPFELTSGPILAPVVQVNDVFDAADKDIVRQIENYAAQKMEDSPLGAEKVKTSTGYMRFVSHQVIGRLLFDYSVRTGLVYEQDSRWKRKTQEEEF